MKEEDSGGPVEEANRRGGRQTDQLQVRTKCYLETKDILDEIQDEVREDAERRTSQPAMEFISEKLAVHWRVLLS